jgi:hypothetical protein
VAVKINFVRVVVRAVVRVVVRAVVRVVVRAVVRVVVRAVVRVVVRVRGYRATPVLFVAVRLESLSDSTLVVKYAWTR